MSLKSLIFLSTLIIVAYSARATAQSDQSSVPPEIVPVRSTPRLRTLRLLDSRKQPTIPAFRKLPNRKQSFHNIYYTRIGALLRNFDRDSVLCYPGDLKHHHPGCECCGGWQLSRYGKTCREEFEFDCTEEYKKDRYRPASAYLHEALKSL